MLLHLYIIFMRIRVLLYYRVLLCIRVLAIILYGNLIDLIRRLYIKL